MLCNHIPPCRKLASNLVSLNRSHSYSHTHTHTHIACDDTSIAVKIDHGRELSSLLLLLLRYVQQTVRMKWRWWCRHGGGWKFVALYYGARNCILCVDMRRCINKLNWFEGRNPFKARTRQRAKLFVCCWLRWIFRAACYLFCAPPRAWELKLKFLISYFSHSSHNKFDAQCLKIFDWLFPSDWLPPPGSL